MFPIRSLCRVIDNRGCEHHKPLRNVVRRLRCVAFGIDVEYFEDDLNQVCRDEGAVEASFGVHPGAQSPEFLKSSNGSNVDGLTLHGCRREMEMVSNSFVRKISRYLSQSCCFPSRHVWQDKTFPRES